MVRPWASSLVAGLLLFKEAERRTARPCYSTSAVPLPKNSMLEDLPVP